MTSETKSWLARVAQRAFTAPETVVQTYKLALDIIERGVPGDLVECGVYAGAQCAAMARALMDVTGFGTNAPRRDWALHIHLFDSFEGIPAPSSEDHEFIAHGTSAGDAACSMEQVKANMRDWGIHNDLLVYHPGWFSETVPAASNATQGINPLNPYASLGKIALLRLDSDLYVSTRICMQHLFPLVSRGGWVIVDDYPLSGCRKAVSEFWVPQPMYGMKL